ncbi:MAG: hypothetical protein ACLS6W_02360 [Ruminococcus sp.]
MAFFENIEIQKLFCAEEADTFPPFTEKDLAETEKAMGWKLPAIISRPVEHQKRRSYC